MAHDAGVVVTRCKRDGVQRFRQRANLVDLHQHAVGNMFGNAALQARDIGDEQVIANKLDLAAEFLCERGPSGPVVFCHSVFNRHDWVFTGKHLPPRSEFVARQYFSFTRQVVLAIFKQLTHGWVESDGNVFARREAGRFNCFHQN